MDAAGRNSLVLLVFLVILHTCYSNEPETRDSIAVRPDASDVSHTTDVLSLDNVTVSAAADSDSASVADSTTDDFLDSGTTVDTTGSLINVKETESSTVGGITSNETLPVTGNSSDPQVTTSSTAEDSHKNPIFLSSTVLIAVSVIAGCVVVIFIVWIIIIIFYRDRICNQPREPEEEPPEYIDSDNELYSIVNYRHHGARTDYQPLELQDQKLVTKMEIDDDGESVRHNMSSDGSGQGTNSFGRYKSKEGLIYTTVKHEPGKEGQKFVQTPEVAETKLEYASLDFKKSGKYVITEDIKNKKRRKDKKPIFKVPVFTKKKK